MSKCSDERIGIGGNPGQPKFNIPLSSIKSIVTMLKCAFSVADVPMSYISPTEISLGVKNRLGISKSKVLAEVLNKMKASDIQTGPNTDGSENKVNKYTKAIVDSVVDNIIKNSKSLCVLKAGTVIGSNQGGPLTVSQDILVEGITV